MLSSAQRLIIYQLFMVYECPNAWVKDFVRHWDALSRSGCVKKAGQTLKSCSKKLAPEEENDAYVIQSVYSFTDCKLTREAAKQLQTEQALAKLYEHVRKNESSSRSSAGCLLRMSWHPLVPMLEQNGEWM